MIEVTTYLTTAQHNSAKEFWGVDYSKNLWFGLNDTVGNVFVLGDKDPYKITTAGVIFHTPTDKKVFDPFTKHAL